MSAVRRGRRSSFESLAVVATEPLLTRGRWCPILQGMSAVLEWEGLVLSGHILGLVFLGCTVLILLAYLFSVERIGVNSVCAGLCVYLLLGRELPLFGILWDLVGG